MFFYNYLTGDFTGCVSGFNLAVPQRLRTGLTANSDMAGTITLASGTGTYTFTQTYATAPTCIGTDTTAANAVKLAATTTVLTFTGTTTDVINYVCVAHT